MHLGSVKYFIFCTFGLKYEHNGLLYTLRTLINGVGVGQVINLLDQMTCLCLK